ncbi:MAG: hypothetical protein R3F43_17790 [bacterium]
MYWRAEVKEKNRSIFVRLFKLAFKLDDPDRRTLGSLALQEAWTALVDRRHLWAAVDDQTSTRLLDLSKVSIAPVDHAWLCPATRRLLPVTLRGYFPYALALPGEGPKARRFDLPVPPGGAAQWQRRWDRSRRAPSTSRSLAGARAPLPRGGHRGGLG